MIKHEDLLEVIKYDPSTGIFKYIKNIKRKKAGSIANTKHSSGYIQIGLYGEIYLAHRLACFYMTKEWPEDQMDHINHIRNDNRWCNLREATNITNHMNRPMQANNKSGFTGVYFSNTYEKWIAEIKILGKKSFLGRYDKLEDAISARMNGNLKHGFHKNHGSCK